ncbi:MAG: hypothetical protein F6K00_11030 [Leptolyngbya sp. SIOISBB]|nr:hypothetical protein [Leptolyngbya sp. SIOISBB]
MTIRLVLGRFPPVIDKDTVLQGALTDIDLQRELLVQRLGVLPGNIVTLLDAEATVSKILTAVQEHLVNQAQPGDTVLFHFSGLGSQASFLDKSTVTALPTLVAADSRWPEDETPVVQDLFVENLSQLLANLRGVKVLTVIDASPAPFSTVQRGNFRVRSRPAVSNGAWRSLGETPLTQPTQAWPSLTANWPGMLLQPCLDGALALEGNWPGFSAGLFTYALTQQIWMSMPAQRQQWFMHRVDRKLSAWTGGEQSSQVFGKTSTKRPGIPLLSGRLPQPAADGVLQSVDPVNQSAIVWLGGLPSILLPYSELGLRLQPLPRLPGLLSVPDSILSVKEVDGLRAKVTLTNAQALSAGVPVIEVERRLPKEIALTLALDPALERIERVDATSALAGMSHISTIAPGERAADCLFGKSRSLLQLSELSTDLDSTTAGGAKTTSESDVIPPGYGLFTPNASLIAGTTAEEEEAVKTAVTRLMGTLHSLLAVKMLRLTLNPVSSRLPVRLVLETQAPNSQLLWLEETLRSRQLSSTDLSKSSIITFGSLTRNRPEKYQIRLANAGVDTVYYLLVSVIDKTRLSVYCPPLDIVEGSEQTSHAIAQESILPGDTSVKYPQMPDTSFSLSSLRTTEVFAIACTAPLFKTWKTLKTTEFRYQSDRWATVPDPLAMAQALLQDLNQASAQLQENENTDLPPEHVLALRSAAWATLSL